MPYVEVRVPKLGLTMTSARVVKWFKGVGDKVEKDEVIAEVETEKLTSEVRAPASGVIKEIKVPEGAEANVGEVLAIIETEESVEVEEVPTKGTEVGVEEGISEVSTERTEVAKVPKGRVKASPAARRLAREYGIDISKVVGSGPGGIVLKSDVIRYLKTSEVTKPSVTEAVKALPEVLEEIQLTPMRVRIAENLSRSVKEAVLTTITMEVRVDELVRIREHLPEEVRPSVTAFIVKAAALALRKYRVLNASLIGSKLMVFKEINVAVATTVEEGLLTPVVRNADVKSVAQIHKEIKELATKAREGRLSIDELKGSTFTVSNLGMFGVDVFTPILQPGQVGILGVGRIYDKLVMENGRVNVGKFMILSLSFDHRVVDGAEAAKFLLEIKKLLENPYLILLSK